MLPAKENFVISSGTKLDVIRGLLSDRKGGTPFSPAVREFALTLRFYSPKAYDFLRQTFDLPAASTLRSIVCTVNCMPGFQEEAFKVGNHRYLTSVLLLQQFCIPQTALAAYYYIRVLDMSNLPVKCKSQNW